MCVYTHNLSLFFSSFACWLVPAFCWMCYQHESCLVGPGRSPSHILLNPPNTIALVQLKSSISKVKVWLIEHSPQFLDLLHDEDIGDPVKVAEFDSVNHLVVALEVNPSPCLPTPCFSSLRSRRHVAPGSAQGPFKAIEPEDSGRVPVRPVQVVNAQRL